MKRMVGMVVLAVVACNADAHGQDANEIAEELRERAERIATVEVEFEQRVAYPGRPEARPPARSRWIVKGHDRQRVRVHAVNREGVLELAQDMAEVRGVTVNRHPMSTARISDAEGPHWIMKDHRLFPLLLGRVFERAELVSAKVEDGAVVLRWANPDGMRPERDIIARFGAEAPYPIREVTFAEDLDEPAPRTVVEFAGGDALDGGADVVLPSESRRLAGWDEQGEQQWRLESKVIEARVNVDLPDDAFEIDLPADVKVIDERRDARAD